MIAEGWFKSSTIGLRRDKGRKAQKRFTVANMIASWTQMGSNPNLSLYTKKSVQTYKSNSPNTNEQRQTGTIDFYVCTDTIFFSHKPNIKNLKNISTIHGSTNKTKERTKIYEQI